jgi:hypothetical protein
MLLIYTPQSTKRFQYICKFIFEEVLNTSYSLTLDEQNFNRYYGNKINYSNKLLENCFHIIPQGLLFEIGIIEQTMECFERENIKAFFKTNSNDFSFDIFAAAFYLITRYEEYLPHKKDMYGRYAHENSIAYKEDFLNKPLINIWLEDFKEKLQIQFPSLSFKPKHFSFLPTYDIDMAWSYKQKGFVRNAVGFLKNPSIGRLKTLLHLKEDPFDCYKFLNEIHKKYNLNPLYFFLVAQKNGVYDKNILPDNEVMQALIIAHAERYGIGIHPSWRSYDEPKILKEEKNLLETISAKKIKLSRQHYIKFNLPEGYYKLIDIGIHKDYSMGYATANGFRASVATSFYWYDLVNEKITHLRIHPFCFMDANCFYEQKLSVDESFEELMHYYQINKKVNGEMITIFHNSFLGTGKEFTGWPELYLKFISQLP